MDGGKFLEASHPPETEPRVFSPPERQVGILRTMKSELCSGTLCVHKVASLLLFKLLITQHL